MTLATKRAEARRQIHAHETALANLLTEKTPAGWGRVAAPLALTAAGLGALFYALRRPAPLTEPHEQVIARWEDEGGNVLSVDELHREAEEVVEAATKKVSALKATLSERGGEILAFAKEQAQKADLPAMKSGLEAKVAESAEQGLGEARKMIRKHPIAATLAAGAVGGLLAMMVAKPRR